MGYARNLNIETRTVDIHIAKLRRKIEADPRQPASLIDRINIAEARSFADYTFLVVSGDPSANFVQRSPLSELPVTQNLPGVMGYFQVGSEVAEYEEVDSQEAKSQEPISQEAKSQEHGEGDESRQRQMAGINAGLSNDSAGDKDQLDRLDGMPVEQAAQQEGVYSQAMDGKVYVINKQPGAEFRVSFPSVPPLV